MKKISNLEAFYYETPKAKPFAALSNIELWRLETSEEYRRFLIRGIWTKVIGYIILGVVVGSVLMAIGTHI